MKRLEKMSRISKRIEMEICRGVGTGRDHLRSAGHKEPKTVKIRQQRQGKCSQIK
jgi:hypothetical protein